MDVKLSQSSWFYMDIKLDFGENCDNSSLLMGVKQFKYAVFLALKTMHGDVGCAIPVDILKYDEKQRRAFIRIPSREVTKVWNSLLLFSSYEGLECMFRVYKVSPVLACLNMNSRLYNHKLSSNCS
ncbi:hypothetical protein JTE90_017061 [Oedothorax gibbosus]|uniref:Ribonucleases P/MRP subunit Pop8-like domain-containing protein n=1 Tax=Oedothorax gibbosus TaxID=931172 RepID=A0AAV6UMW6_9ARAC|nr:hypothetical protein JTE90_017061 [Oedothorax gibbosus]